MYTIHCERSTLSHFLRRNSCRGLSHTEWWCMMYCPTCNVNRALPQSWGGACSRPTRHTALWLSQVLLSCSQHLPDWMNPCLKGYILHVEEFWKKLETGVSFADAMRGLNASLSFPPNFQLHHLRMSWCRSIAPWRYRKNKNHLIVDPRVCGKWPLDSFEVLLPASLNYFSYTLLHTGPGRYGLAVASRSMTKSIGMVAVPIRKNKD